MKTHKKVWFAVLLSLLTEILLCAITIPLKGTSLNEVYLFFHVVGPLQYWVTMILVFIMYRSIQILTGSRTTSATLPVLTTLLTLSVTGAVWTHVSFRNALQQDLYPRIEREAKDQRQAETARRHFAMQSYYPIIWMGILTMPTGFLLRRAARNMKNPKEMLQQSPPPYGSPAAGSPSGEA